MMKYIKRAARAIKHFITKYTDRLRYHPEFKQLDEDWMEVMNLPGYMPKSAFVMVKGKK